MIRNVFGKPVTRSTAKSFLEMEMAEGDPISREDIARVALSMKNSQGTSTDEIPALRYVHRLKVGNERDLRGLSQLGGGLISNPFPLRIHNGQWGMFCQEKRPVCVGAVLYRGSNGDGLHCFWCVASKSEGAWHHSQPNVHVKIVREIDWDEDNSWESVRTAIQETCPLHKANNEGLYSIITTSYGHRVVFEALLTLKCTSRD